MTGSEFSGPPEAVIKKDISSSPFTYERTYNPDQAELSFRRVSGIKTVGRDNRRTDEEILAQVRKTTEAPYWTLDKYWSEKGIPLEQIELGVGDRRITVFNFNAETPVTEDRLSEIKDALGKMQEHFPGTVIAHDYILIDDKQPVDPLAGGVLQSGSSDEPRRALVLYPRGMELTPSHRVSAASNLAGTVVHEATHPIVPEFSAEWSEHFQWRVVSSDSELGRENAESGEWEWRAIQTGEMKLFNRQTGEMLQQGEIPVQPEECITGYARQSLAEDVCDSMVGYLYDPELLESKSPTKLAILEGHDAKGSSVEVTALRVPDDQVALPTIEPRTVRYYIQEPAA